MKKLIYITISLILLQSCSQSTEKIRETWIYSPDYGGKIFTGLVFNINDQNNSIESLIADVRIDSLNQSGGFLISANDTLAKIIWRNKECLVAYFEYDTICLHKVKDLQISDSIGFVYNFLINNIIEFEDEASMFENEPIKYVVDFDTLSIRRFSNFNFKNFMVSDNVNEYGFESGLWELKSINNSLILYYNPPFFGFSRVWEIEKVYEDSIVCRLLSVPYKERPIFFRKVNAVEKYSFDYQRIAIKKRQSLRNDQFDSTSKYLSTNEWRIFDVDSTRLMSWGRFEFNKDVILFPPAFDSITYRFTDEFKYQFIIGRTVFEGDFSISPDGAYILTDTAITNHDYLCIKYAQKDTLILEQYVNIRRDQEVYDQYRLKLFFKKNTGHNMRYN